MRASFFAVLFTASALLASATPVPVPVPDPTRMPQTHREWADHHYSQHSQYMRLSNQHRDAAKAATKKATRAKNHRDFNAYREHRAAAAHHQEKSARYKSVANEHLDQARQHEWHPRPDEHWSPIRQHRRSIDELD
ncbi:hypothetical protein PIIN_09895 [Serendipita indica DSM 11827]|uniref:Uncharacterized protein n=1 Tax=Serendipita indica (strain DSM 11827) TaxID=1109443 RepID=G4TX56_SERID|nr:hypothetical protein PIIN_09895 [Serendipita indica DSM 11827]